MNGPPASHNGTVIVDDIPKNTPGLNAVPETSNSEIGDGPKIAIFASGRGSDFQAIIDANEKGEVHLNITLLLCNNKDAFAIERARTHSIPYVILDHGGKERRDYDREIHDVLEDNGIDLIVLAGFMRILSPWFVSRWKGKIINIHPALLPAFPGAHAHKDVLEYGVKVTGLTVHYVDEKVDHGPIIFQLPVEVLDDDNIDTLSKRVLEQEHKWYPRVIEWISDGKVKVEGRKVLVNRPDIS
jgi:phosphoribosylglycinamide formyltransferase 1